MHRQYFTNAKIFFLSLFFNLLNISVKSVSLLYTLHVRNTVDFGPPCMQCSVICIGVCVQGRL